mmetsp:Transcript_41042/g.108459  ORF Transcript_41042/g.108459 Transcript_41042/m.108459 type:complete len:675 (+) Transcript_41042:116-2140(+)
MVKPDKTSPALARVGTLHNWRQDRRSIAGAQPASPRRRESMAQQGQLGEDYSWRTRLQALDMVLGDMAYSMKHHHAFKIYIGVTVIFQLAIFAGCQCIGYFAWTQMNYRPLIDVIAEKALHTDVPWYVPAEVSPTGVLSDVSFLRYATLMLWITCVVTGLGMELVIGEHVVDELEVSKTLMQAWKASQLFFSLCISIALFSQSPFGYPFLVLGFWKMGFPETMGYFRRAFCIGKVNFDSVGAYLNGTGTFIHHSTGAYLIVCCSTGLMPLDRRILSMSLPLVAQHIVVLTKYLNPIVYGLCELGIEIVFEWEIFSNLNALGAENGYDISSRGTALAMLVAHWIYWAAAFCSVPGMLGVSDDTVVIIPDATSQLGIKRQVIRQVSRQPSSRHQLHFNLAGLSKAIENISGSDPMVPMVGHIPAGSPIGTFVAGMDCDAFWKHISDHDLPVNESQARMLFSIGDADGDGVLDLSEVKNLFSMFDVIFKHESSFNRHSFKGSSPRSSHRNHQAAMHMSGISLTNSRRPSFITALSSVASKSALEGEDEWDEDWDEEKVVAEEASQAEAQPQAETEAGAKATVEPRAAARPFQIDPSAIRLVPRSFTRTSSYRGASALTASAVTSQLSERPSGQGALVWPGLPPGLPPAKKTSLEVELVVPSEAREDAGSSNAGASSE